jgi:putative transposase
MHRIDEINTRWPVWGSRKITAKLNHCFRQEQLTLLVNRKRIKRLMGMMGIQAIYPKKKTSIPDRQHHIYPYLLRDMLIDRPNQVWGIDITYIRLVNGWIYLTAIIDWFARFVIAWETSITMDTDMVVNAVNKAFEQNLPDILNSDQGSQMTSGSYTNLLKANNVKISMDSRGRFYDNIFTERLWRSVKYEEVYLKDYQTPKEARQNLNQYFHDYNYERPHQNLDDFTPAEIYFKNIKN